MSWEETLEIEEIIEESKKKITLETFKLLKNKKREIEEKIKKIEKKVSKEIKEKGSEELFFNSDLVFNDLCLEKELRKELWKINEILTNAEIIEKDITGEKIKIGTIVELEIKGSQKEIPEEIQVAILGYWDSRLLINLKEKEIIIISPCCSPLGRAILEKTEGEKVKIKTPSGEKEIKIKKYE